MKGIRKMRLTEKIGNDLYRCGNNFIEGYEIVGYPIQKLGQLEDLEEEIGIDLIVFLKMLTQGQVYTKEFGNVNIDLFFPDKGNWSFDTADGKIFYIKDHGKTWTLKTIE